MALTKATNRMIDDAFINVKDFGATGDGTTDDTSAVQAAFNSISAVPNLKTVFFPSGTYIINTTIDTNPNTTNSTQPQIMGESAQSTTIKAGASLGANPILSHQGASPSKNARWSGFRLLGTGAADGQYGVLHVNTCFLNYDNIVFESLQEGVRFENLGAGFTEQNVLTNCWAPSTKYFIGFARQSGSSESSFRGTGFGSNCHHNLTTVADARLVRVYLLNSLAPNCYDMPVYATVWTESGDAVFQNDCSTPIRASGHIRYESSATGWSLGTGAGSTTDTFRGLLDGISFNPTFGQMDFVGILNGNQYQDTGSFTPVLSGSTGNPTVTYAANGQQGFYEALGNTVYFSIFLNITSYTGGSGNLQVTGLPLTSRTTTGSVSVDRISLSANKLTFSGVPVAAVLNNSTTLAIRQMTTGGDEANITLASLATANSTLFISGSYTWAQGN